ncbi:OsmC family protein [Alphaproteobacteria bacterium]|nr:OsmC family protein [Alphaproteobacteria bacterium]
MTVNDNISFPASSAPEYGGNKNNLNPEQGLVAAISSCHMMTFLALASKMKWPVLKYSDKAYAYLGKNSKGQMSVNKIELNPKIIFNDNFEVSKNEMEKMQDRAHRYCFIANSLSKDVEIKINL